MKDNFLWLSFLVSLFMLPGLAGADQVRRPSVAGLFYPGERQELIALVDGYLAKAPLHTCADREVIALIVPHAGYVYSGKTAAQAYRQIQGESYEVAVVIGPSHSMGFKGGSLYDGDYYETPLGKIKIDQALSQTLVRLNKGFRFASAPHRKEHSIEVQLPFLQRSLKDFSLVPILIGSQDLPEARDLSQALIQALKGRKAILIASTDLSHYHPAKVARRLDGSAQEAIRALDGPSLIRRVESGEAELCGAGPVATVLLTAKGLGASRVDILHYTDSSEVSGDVAAVVGYLAAAISKGKEEGISVRPPKAELNLDPGLQKELLDLARRAIEDYLTQGKVLDPQVSAPELLRPGAAFVTLTERGDLRGCIGFTEPLYPLYHTVIRCAIAAATSDPRFPPLKASELGGIRIEISVLSPIEEIQDVSQIQVGRHGILVEKEGRRGLLLPQVATEYHWDRRTFLEQTCRKAGLPADAWRKGAKIFIFSGEIFHEER